MEIGKIQYISQAPANQPHLQAIEKALKTGCKWVQLRVKEHTEAEVLVMAIMAKRICDQYEARLIVNDYPQVALRAGAFGVHLGLDDMPIGRARAILGNNHCIGGTANTFADIQRRAREGVDYIGLGPFRFTSTKKNLSPLLGIEGYHRIMEQVHAAGIKIPIIAIGGIDLPDIGLLLETGIHGIALSGLLTDNPHLNKEFYVNYSR